MRKVALLSASALAALLLSSGAAFAEIIIGTQGADNLVGTNSNDYMRGDGGNDSLRGKAGNDSYQFFDAWGTDTLTETATVKVGKKRLPGGTDTLNFSYVRGGALEIKMIPQWTTQGYNKVVSDANSIDLGTSPVENAVGGSRNDTFAGGSADNTYKSGPDIDTDLDERFDNSGGWFLDYGGNDGSAVGNPDLPDLPASNDTYRGFVTTGAATYEVRDYGGSADKLDLRPLELSEVYFARSSFAFGSNDTLRIGINGATISVIGYFAPVPDIGLRNGHVEQIIFSDQVVTHAASEM